jgi:RNA polymerase sigma factor (sigma-70 family)
MSAAAPNGARGAPRPWSILDRFEESIHSPLAFSLWTEPEFEHSILPAGWAPFSILVSASENEADPAFGSGRRSADSSSGDEDLELAQRYLASLQFKQPPEDEAAAAWRRFYAAHDPQIRRTLHASGLARSHLDDCVQEVWAELSLKLPLFVLDPTRGTFAAWLSQVTRRKAREYRRRWDRFGRLRFDRGVALSEICCPGVPDPSKSAEASELRDRVRELVHEFEGRETRLNWLILQHCTIHGRSAEQAARRLNVPVQHVWTRHCRTRLRLRRFLEGQLGISARRSAADQ